MRFSFWGFIGLLKWCQSNTNELWTTPFMTDKHMLDHCTTVVDLCNPQKVKRLYTSYNSIVCSLALNPKFLSLRQNHTYAHILWTKFSIWKKYVAKIHSLLKAYRASPSILRNLKTCYFLRELHLLRILLHSCQAQCKICSSSNNNKSRFSKLALK
jgi:hypothetical protein